MFGIVVESTLSRGTSFAGAARQAEPEERRALRHCDGVDKADAGPKNACLEIQFITGPMVDDS